MHSQTNNKIQFWEFYDITEKSVTTTNTLENFMLKFNLRSDHEADYLSSTFFKLKVSTGNKRIF